VTDEQKALRLQACQEFSQSVDDDQDLFDSAVMTDEAWLGTCQALQGEKKNVISKVKKQSDVGHIFQQSGNLIPQNTFGT
jgi:hypothetical protein